MAVIINEELLKVKAYQFTAAKLEDKVFRCLLKDEKEDLLKRKLGYIYFIIAQNAKYLAKSQPLLQWRLLDEIPTKFELQSKVVETAFSQGLESQDGTMREESSEVTVSRAHALVEDRVGRWVNDAYASGEDALPKKRKKRQPKKAKIGKVEAGTDKPAPKGKAKEGAKKKI
ncbi:hypothetical protein PITC_099860 [Penicillium italicum]|uniref:Uncharacterized protein n=1 Tax=Penicillium italicum TaxID=40296 RepID=A0A0A2LCZ1_PENIT|nr:hypothetical protein PITC_099860 [Penicillium italicum]